MGELRPIAVDACVAINLRATERWSEIFRGGGWSPLMPSVAFGEVLYLFDDDGERTEASLAEYVQHGELDACDLDPHELELMLSMAATLGAGEAASIAVAHARGLPLATDDRAARRHTLAQKCNQVTTPQLIRMWADRERPESAAVARVISMIETRARYRPRHDDPDSTWWGARGNL